MKGKAKQKSSKPQINSTGAVLITANPSVKEDVTTKITKKLVYVNKGTLTSYQLVGNDLFFLYQGTSADGATNSSQGIALCSSVKVHFIRMYDEATTESALAVTYNSTRTNKNRVIQPGSGAAYVSDTGKVRPPKGSLIEDSLIASTDGALNVAFLSGLSTTTVIELYVTIELFDTFTLIAPDVPLTCTYAGVILTTPGLWRGRLNALGTGTTGIIPLGYLLGSSGPTISSIP